MTIRLILSLAISFAPLAFGQEWTRFRGPNGTGLSDTKTIPTNWTDADYHWKTQLPGQGHSSPVLWGDKIFLTSTDEKAGTILLSRVDASDGKIAWSKEYHFAPYGKHRFNSFASATPAVDSERAYFTWSTPQSYRMIALNHDGSVAWERDLGPFQAHHGSGTSPIVYEDLVILANDQDKTSYIIAVEASTGETRWMTPRDSTNASYSTPCVYQQPGRDPVLIFNSQSHGIFAVAPKDGNVVWELGGLFDKRSVSSALVASGLMIGSCGSGGGGNYVVAIRPGDPTAGKQPELAYEIRRSAPYVPTSLAIGDLLFLWSDGGIVTCLDAPTGKAHWQERVGGDYFGSPIGVDGRVYCISTAGEMVVIRASDKFEVLARNHLGEPAYTTPAIANGRMYIRTLKHLISLGGPQNAGKQGG